MVIAGSRPILRLATLTVRGVARLLPLPRQLGAYFLALSLVPLFGSLITEPGAMTLAAKFGKPVLTNEPDGKVSALIEVHDRPKGAAGPVPLVVTVRGTPSPVETRLDLDIPAAKP